MCSLRYCRSSEEEFTPTFDFRQWICLTQVRTRPNQACRREGPTVQFKGRGKYWWGRSLDFSSSVGSLSPQLCLQLYLISFHSLLLLFTHLHCSPFLPSTQILPIIQSFTSKYTFSQNLPYTLSPILLSPLKP